MKWLSLFLPAGSRAEESDFPEIGFLVSENVLVTCWESIFREANFFMGLRMVAGRPHLYLHGIPNSRCGVNNTACLSSASVYAETVQRNQYCRYTCQVQRPNIILQRFLFIIAELTEIELKHAVLCTLLRECGVPTKH